VISLFEAPPQDVCICLPCVAARRFSIGQNNRVSWLGWQLYVGYLPHYGPRYMDVRFKGERIAYEISMQEALACE
jgi:primary-amine oxidase